MHDLNLNSSFSSCNDPNIIDLTVLASYVCNDSKKVIKYAARFIETTQNTLIEMNAAISTKDISELSALGHRLKSSSFMVGAMRFGNLCEELEQLKNTEDLEKAIAVLQKLHDLFEQINIRLKNII